MVLLPGHSRVSQAAYSSGLSRHFGALPQTAGGSGAGLQAGGEEGKVLPAPALHSEAQGGSHPLYAKG